eukprot:g24400.t1
MDMDEKEHVHDDDYATSSDQAGGGTEQDQVALEEENERLRQRVFEQNSQLQQFQHLQVSLEQALQMVTTLAQDFQRLQANLAEAGITPLVDYEDTSGGGGGGGGAFVDNITVDKEQRINQLLYNGTKMWAYFPKGKKKRLLLYMRNDEIIVGGTTEQDGVFKFPLKDISDIYMGKGQASPGFSTPYAASLDPNLCFTIMATRPERKKIVFDLVAPDQQTREDWLLGLRRALTQMGKTLSIAEAPIANAAAVQAQPAPSTPHRKAMPKRTTGAPMAKRNGATTPGRAPAGAKKAATGVRAGSRGSPNQNGGGPRSTSNKSKESSSSRSSSRRTGSGRGASGTRGSSTPGFMKSTKVSGAKSVSRVPPNGPTGLPTNGISSTDISLQYPCSRIDIPPNPPGDTRRRISISFSVFTIWAEIAPPFRSKVAHNDNLRQSLRTWEQEKGDSNPRPDMTQQVLWAILDSIYDHIEGISELVLEYMDLSAPGNVRVLTVTHTDTIDEGKVLRPPWHARTIALIQHEIEVREALSANTLMHARGLHSTIIFQEIVKSTRFKKSSRHHFCVLLYRPEVAIYEGLSTSLCVPLPTPRPRKGWYLLLDPQWTHGRANLVSTTERKILGGSIGQVSSEYRRIRVQRRTYESRPQGYDYQTDFQWIQQGLWRFGMITHIAHDPGYVPTDPTENHPTFWVTFYTRKGATRCCQARRPGSSSTGGSARRL